MTLLLILALQSIQLPSGDGAVVMLSGIPAAPWSGLSGDQLEQMWTYGIEGYQVTRSGWSGYLLRGPSGCGEVLTGLCETLAADSIVPDSSLWARTLQLVWNTNALPGFVVITDSITVFPVLPVRSSQWLAAGADTLILSLPVANTILFWGGGYSGDFHLAAWRGIGSEVIPAAGRGIASLVSYSMDGSPSDIISLEYVPAELDGWWGETWDPLLAIADSIVVAQIPSGLGSVNSLVWIKGTGGQTLNPWTMIPSPSPPVVASLTVEPLPGVVPMYGFPDLPDVLTVVFPGNAGSASRAAYAAYLLERIVARMVLTEGVLCRGAYSTSGEVRLLFSGTEWDEAEALGIIADELSPIIFTAPEGPLMNNAAVKAGIPVMDQRETVDLLARVTGFLVQP